MEMDKDERELEEFERSLTRKNYAAMIGIALLLVGAGIACSWAVFSMISSAINSYFGG